MTQSRACAFKSHHVSKLACWQKVRLHILNVRLNAPLLLWIGGCTAKPLHLHLDFQSPSVSNWILMANVGIQDGDAPTLRNGSQTIFHSVDCAVADPFDEDNAMILLMFPNGVH
jgi:hypothetical protein